MTIKTNNTRMSTPIVTVEPRKPKPVQEERMNYDINLPFPFTPFDTLSKLLLAVLSRECVVSKVLIKPVKEGSVGIPTPSLSAKTRPLCLFIECDNASRWLSWSD